MATYKELDLFWLTVALISIASSSAYYTWVWKKPGQFKKLISPRDPCEVMCIIANVLKVVQFSSIFLLTEWSRLFSLAAWQYVVLLGLAGFGQHLNYLVYNKLGMNGVYYGCCFGKSIPWVKEYPYSHFKDPQYIGSMATLIGFSVIIPTEVVMWWMANYVYLMWLESSKPVIAKD